MFPEKGYNNLKKSFCTYSSFKFECSTTKARGGRLLRREMMKEVDIDNVDDTKVPYADREV